MLHGGISEGCCKELHRLQNRAALIILWKNTSNDTFHVLNWLTLSSRRKMHKCILVFKCLSNLVAKYLTQYFTRNADLHNHATTCTRRNNLHPPKPKCNMGKLKIWWLLKYFNLQHSFNIISYSTHFLYWLSWIFIVLLLIFIMYIIDIKLSNLWIVYILFFISHGPYGYQSRCWMGYPC